MSSRNSRQSGQRRHANSRAAAPEQRPPSPPAPRGGTVPIPPHPRPRRISPPCAMCPWGPASLRPSATPLKRRALGWLRRAVCRAISRVWRPLNPSLISDVPVADHFRETPPWLPEYFRCTLVFNPTKPRTSFTQFGVTQLKKKEHRRPVFNNGCVCAPGTGAHVHRR